MTNFVEFDSNGTPIIVWLVPTSNPDMVGQVKKVITQQKEQTTALIKLLRNRIKETLIKYKVEIVEYLGYNCVISYLVWTSDQIKGDCSPTEESRVVQTKNYLVWTQPG